MTIDKWYSAEEQPVPFHMGIALDQLSTDGGQLEWITTIIPTWTRFEFAGKSLKLYYISNPDLKNAPTIRLFNIVRRA